MAESSDYLSSCLTELLNEMLLRNAEKGDLGTLQSLIEEGADVNFRDINFQGRDGPWFGYSAIECAALNGHRECAELLIKAGAEVNDSSALECTALYGHHDVMQVLIRAGADVNTQDEMGFTPIMHAAEEGFERCVEQLVQAGADVNLCDDTGYSALMVAAVHNYDAIVHMLINAGADVNASVAEEHSTKELVTSQSTTPLISGAGSRRCLDLLIEAGADVNGVNDEGNSALLTAASYGKPECVHALLRAGAEVNTRNKNGDFALMMIGRKKKSSIGEQLRCVQLLLKAGVHVNMENKSAQNAIDCYVVNSQQPHEVILHSLAAAGEIWRAQIYAESLLRTPRHLKYLSRDAIRRHLLDINPVNLLVRIPELEGRELPFSLCSYLLHHINPDKIF